ncbi:MAG: c-type cytochrome [Rhodothermales bacterium]|nr:c-type cytochrome [Rhodothermales bacterium]
MTRAPILLPVLLLAGPLAAPLAAQEPDLGTEAQRAAGLELYLDKCAQCHGDDGAGQGPGAPFFQPAPRDFTTGIFKFRSTPGGELPTDADLRRSIREGMPYTGMPGWPQLSEQEVQNLVYAIKTFNDDFAGPYGVVEPIEIPDAPGFSEAAAERGRAVYVENECFTCHGDQGRGNGESAPTLENHWGEPIRPADLTKRWTFSNGSEREDIYRTFTTGLDGTPMPSYELPAEDSWALVDYVYSLSRDGAEYGTVVVSEGVAGPLDLSQGRALFEAARPTYFPVVGQVIEPGRAFQPGVNGVEVRAVHTADEIALLLVWHDMVADRSGTNSPTMEAPRFGAAADTTAAAASAETAGAVTTAPEAAPASAFSDAVAVQFPAEPTEGNEKPYFLFGDERHPVELWFADLAGETAERLLGRGHQQIEPAEGAPDFRAAYEDGAWVVLFKGPRLVEGGLSFEEEAFVPIAFSVWDGFNAERGNRRGITSWYHLYVAPLETQSAAVPMAQWALLALVLELGLVFFVRRKYKGEVT